MLPVAGRSSLATVTSAVAGVTSAPVLSNLPDVTVGGYVGEQLDTEKVAYPVAPLANDAEAVAKSSQLLPQAKSSAPRRVAAAAHCARLRPVRSQTGLEPASVDRHQVIPNLGVEMASVDVASGDGGAGEDKPRMVMLNAIVMSACGELTFPTQGVGLKRATIENRNSVTKVANMLDGEVDSSGSRD